MKDSVDRGKQLSLLLLGRPLRAQGEEPDLQTAHQRLDLLAGLVIELLIEVEALREAQLGAARASGQLGRDTPYGEAYRETVELSHCSIGPSGGLDKILARWPEDTRDRHGRGAAREVSMLERLGYTRPEIEAFVEHLDELEMLT